MHPPLRLAFGAVFWRVFLVTFSIQQYTAFHKTRRLLGASGFPRKFAAFLNFTPYALVLALLVAVLVAVAFDLLIRLVARPMAALWYAPRRTGSMHTPIDFHLEVGEALVDELPARVRHAKGWRAGTLVLTSRRIGFYPTRSGDEHWLIERSAAHCAIEPPRATLGSFVLGVPGRVAIVGPGVSHMFAVADPARIDAWFSMARLPADATGSLKCRGRREDSGHAPR